MNSQLFEICAIIEGAFGTAIRGGRATPVISTVCPAKKVG
jgi:hypothetical protein